MFKLLTIAFLLFAGCTPKQSASTTALTSTTIPESKPLDQVISGTHGNVYKMCDGTNLVYYAEGSYKAALFVVKDGCTNGR